MFISVLELFKIGIGPSSSHTMGPMVAAKAFREALPGLIETGAIGCRVRVVLRGSLAHTGRGHATDRALLLGLHGYTPERVAEQPLDTLLEGLRNSRSLRIGDVEVGFSRSDDIVFDKGEPLPQHPNGMQFQLLDAAGTVLAERIWFSVGGGFVVPLEQIDRLAAPLSPAVVVEVPFPFDSANEMLAMAQRSGLSISAMKRANELARMDAGQLEQGLEAIWQAMCLCIRNGLAVTGELPGGLHLQRRARLLLEQIRQHPQQATLNDRLCAYAMAVNEENAAGHLVVTAPTNGAAGVIPAVLYHLVEHEDGSGMQVQDFLLTAAAIGGLIKHRSSISGAEVGCQGEVGSAAAMAAAGLCAARGGTPEQVENAAEIALEHHLGMTCDPVGGLVQVPCIERNGFGAIKAHTAAALALYGNGEHFMSLDNCIAAMKQTGQEMSVKFKETSLGGLAVSITEC